jgi:hypothetical protein
VRNIPEDDILHRHRRENLKFYSDLSRFRSAQTDSEAHQGSCIMNTGALFEGQRGWGVKLTTNLHFVLRYERWSYATTTHISSWRPLMLIATLFHHNQRHEQIIWSF